MDKSFSRQCQEQHAIETYRNPITNTSVSQRCLHFNVQTYRRISRHNARRLQFGWASHNFWPKLSNSLTATFRISSLWYDIIDIIPIFCGRQTGSCGFSWPVSLNASFPDHFFGYCYSSSYVITSLFFAFHEPLLLLRSNRFRTLYTTMTVAVGHIGCIIFLSRECSPKCFASVG